MGLLNLFLEKVYFLNSLSRNEIIVVFVVFVIEVLSFEVFIWDLWFYVNFINFYVDMFLFVNFECFLKYICNRLLVLSWIFCIFFIFVEWFDNGVVGMDY